MASDSWYSEVSSYNFSTPATNWGLSVDGGQVGHFTQGEREEGSVGGRCEGLPRRCPSRCYASSAAARGLGGRLPALGRSATPSCSPRPPSCAQWCGPLPRRWAAAWPPARRPATHSARPSRGCLSSASTPRPATCRASTPQTSSARRECCTLRAWLRAGWGPAHALLLGCCGRRPVQQAARSAAVCLPPLLLPLLLRSAPSAAVSQPAAASHTTPRLRRCMTATGDDWCAACSGSTCTQCWPRYGGATTNKNPITLAGGKVGWAATSCGCVMRQLSIRTWRWATLRRGSPPLRPPCPDQPCLHTRAPAAVHHRVRPHQRRLLRQPLPAKGHLRARRCRRRQRWQRGGSWQHAQRPVDGPLISSPCSRRHNRGSHPERAPP